MAKINVWKYPIDDDVSVYAASKSKISVDEYQSAIEWICNYEVSNTFFSLMDKKEQILFELSYNIIPEIYVIPGYSSHRDWFKQHTSFNL